MQGMVTQVRGVSKVCLTMPLVLQTSDKSGFTLAAFAAFFSRGLFQPLLPRVKQHPWAEGSVPTGGKERAWTG